MFEALEENNQRNARVLNRNADIIDGVNQEMRDCSMQGGCLWIEMPSLSLLL